MTAVLTANGVGKSSPEALPAGFGPALIVVTVIAALGVLVALSGLLPRRAAAQETAAEPELALAE